MSRSVAVPDRGAIWEVEVAAGHGTGQDGLTSWQAREPEADSADAEIEAG